MWMTLSKTESEKIFNSWLSNSPPAEYVHPNYADLRKDIINSYSDALNFLQIDGNAIKGKEYDFDLAFGIRFYSLMVSKYNFNERQASDDGVWRYISIYLIPDITYKRWGLNPQRYYIASRRIWIKVLWWYIHLSWQGDTESTFNILKDNTTDEMAQIVDRSGPSGYRVKLCRSIMYHYSNIAVQKKKRGAQVFRRIMKLNTARSRVVEPALIIGGEEQYVKELFEYFGEKFN
ncbi:hypothetical protein MMB68_24465 [Priestia sp. Y58]|uniref:hypothetical protein n=1 Tax=Priestia sp. Y58 TaxID=2922804 RepID=UPI002404AF53|nr:hypothetical protein [Priestia sp. Y58]MDG0032706.1 hypothetical protein [Priestia sp. Y58]